jgi:hypothetical protein
MTPEKFNILRFVGPFFLLLGTLFAILNYETYKTGKIKYGPKNGPKEIIDRTKDPDKFRSTFISVLIPTSFPLLGGIGISVYVFIIKRNRIN